MKMRFWRSAIPQGILTCTAVVVVLGGFLEVGWLQSASKDITAWVSLITPFAMLVGVVTIARIKVLSVIRGRDLFDRCADALILVIGGAVAVLGLTRGLEHPLYVWLIENVDVVVEGGVMGIVALFAASAGRRALKVKNLESGVFVAGMLLAFLSATGLAEAIWGDYPRVGVFFDQVVSMASMRGITIATAAGLISTGLRAIVGIDRSYIGQE